MTIDNYVGKFEVKGINSRNRVTFPSKLLKTFYRRNEGKDPKLYCIKEDDEGFYFLSLWEEETIGDRKGTEIKVDKRRKELIFPEEIAPKSGRLVFLGSDNHIEIFSEYVWGQIKDSKRYEEFREKFGY